MAMRVQTQQPRQHARGPEGPGQDFDIVKLKADRSSSVRPREQGPSRNSGRNCRPVWHVKLKVFDISKGMAELYGGFFVSDKKKGIWHTNVVVFGLEYFYVSTICICPVGMGWPGEEQLTEVLDMGTTERTAFELEAFLRAQQRLFTPNKYDMFKHNCNHFSDLVLRFLNHRLRVPSYIASLPERVLQTTLGKLVYPLVNAAMDRKKSDICQHADKAELCGEIFFYGGVMPLLVPGERSTQVLMKRVVEEFKQQQLKAVAHRSSTAVHRSKSSCRRDRPGDGAALICNRSNSQRAAAVAAFYSGAVLSGRRERARCAVGNEGRVWWSKQPRGEPQLQHQQQQGQQEQSHAEHALKGLLHTRRASSRRRTCLQDTSAAGGDVVPARFNEALPTATAERSSVRGGGVSLEKERRHVLVGGVALCESRNEVDDGWRRRPENWSMFSTPSRRGRPHVAASQHASGTKDAEATEVSGGPQEKQRIHRGSRSSGRSEPPSLSCQWKSAADFFHITDDASSSATGAVPAVMAQPTHQRAARRLRGVSSAKGSDSSCCSEYCRHGNSLASAASHDRVGKPAPGHIAGRAAPPRRDVVTASSDVVTSGEKRTACNFVRGSLTFLHRSHRGADACSHGRRRAASGKGHGPAGVSLKPAAEVTALRNPPCSSVSSASTTVGSRVSAHSSCKATSPSSGSRNNADSRNSLGWSSFAVVPERLKTRALQRRVPHAENRMVADRMDCLPLQSLRPHCRQTAEDTDTTAKMPTRGNLVPSALDAVALGHCSASAFSGDGSAAATGCCNCEARRDTAGGNRPSSRQGSSDCSWSCDGDAPEDDLHSTRGLPSSPQHRHLDVSCEDATEEPDEAGVAWTWTCRDGGVCANRRHTVTSEKLAPVEGDVGVEDTARSRQSSDYSTVSETNDSCADCQTDWIQQQWWTQHPEETQLEQQDPAHQLQATEVGVTRNREKQDLFLSSRKGRRINLLTGHAYSGWSSSIFHDSSAAGSGVQWEPHVQGQVEEYSSAISSPMGHSGSCSCIGTTDAVGKYGASRRERSSATHDRVVLSVSPPEVSRRRSASVDSGSADSEPVWQDAEEQGETQEKEEVDDESRSRKLWLPAVTTVPPPFREATGNAEDSSNRSATEGTPADCSPSLKRSTSTVPPGSNCNSFESASDCCFLESAHEEEERGEEFQEAKEGRTSSDEEKVDPQTAEGTIKITCSGNASSSEEVGSVKLCASGFRVPPTVSWQAGGREASERFTRLSPRRTRVAAKEAHVASTTADAGEPEDIAWQSLLLETNRDGQKTGRCRQSGEKHDAIHAGIRGSGKRLCGASGGRIAVSSSRPARASRRADTFVSSKGNSSHFICSRTGIESTFPDNDEDTTATCAFLRGLEEQENNRESRATSHSVCSDWWQEREERDTSAAHSSSVFPEIRTEVAATCQARSEQQKQEESLKDDFEVLPFTDIRCEDGMWRLTSREDIHERAELCSCRSTSIERKEGHGRGRAKNQHA